MKQGRSNTQSRRGSWVPFPGPLSSRLPRCLTQPTLPVPEQCLESVEKVKYHHLFVTYFPHHIGSLIFMLKAQILSIKHDQFLIFSIFVCSRIHLLGFRENFPTCNNCNLDKSNWLQCCVKYSVFKKTSTSRLVGQLSGWCACPASMKTGVWILGIYRSARDCAG